MLRLVNGTTPVRVFGYGLIVGASSRNMGLPASCTPSTSGKKPALAEGYRSANPPDACRSDGRTLLVWETLDGDMLGQFTP